MSSIMKGLVDESENVNVIYIDGKPAAKYANKYEAEKDANRIRTKFPNKRIEIKAEVREAEGDTLLDPEYSLPQARSITKAIKYDDTVGEIITQIQMLAERTEGIDSKTIEYAIDGVLSAKSALESAVYDLEEAFEDAAREAQYKRDDVDENVGMPFRGVGGAFNRGDDERHDLDVPTQKGPQEWGLKINGKVWSKDGKSVTFASKEQALKARQTLLAKRPELEIGLVTRGGSVSEEKQRLDPKCWTGYKKQGTKMKGGVRVNNCVPVEEAGSPAQQAAIAIAMKKTGKKPKTLGESDSSEAVYNAILNRIMRQHLDLLSEYGPKIVMYAIEDVASGVGDLEEIGSSDVSIWTKEVINDLKSGQYAHLKETPTNDIEEDTAYAGGMGQGGNAGQSYRKFKPKSAGTFESSIMKGLKRESK